VTREELRRAKIKEIPSLFEFFCFVFFFPGFMSGPFTQFTDFKAFMNKSMFAETKGKIPSAFVGSTLTKILVAIFGFIGVKLHDTFSIHYTLTSEFLEYSILYRLAYVYFSIELNICKYYFAWSLGDVAATCAGVSYNGLDQNGNPKWDRILMIRLWDFKAAQNAKELIDNWNISCQFWLKNYVFTMFVKVVPHGLAKFLTFVTSAFWHGFYPAYYLFFVSCGLFELIIAEIRLAFRWRFLNADGTPKRAKILYDFFGWILIQWAMNSLVLSFQLLSFERAVSGWKSIYFIPHIGAFSLYVCVLIFGAKKNKKKAA